MAWSDSDADEWLQGEFEERGWHVDRPGAAHYIYQKDVYLFEVRVVGDTIVVTIPLLDSKTFYRTSFTRYREAEAYLWLHLQAIIPSSTRVM